MFEFLRRVLKHYLILYKHNSHCIVCGKWKTSHTESNCSLCRFYAWLCEKCHKDCDTCKHRHQEVKWPYCHNCAYYEYWMVDE